MLSETKLSSKKKRKHEHRTAVLLKRSHNPGYVSLFERCQAGIEARNDATRARRKLWKDARKALRSRLDVRVRGWLSLWTKRIRRMLGLREAKPIQVPHQDMPGMA